LHHKVAACQGSWKGIIQLWKVQYYADILYYYVTLSSWVSAWSDSRNSYFDVQFIIFLFQTLSSFSRVVVWSLEDTWLRHLNYQVNQHTPNKLSCDLDSSCPLDWSPAVTVSVMLNLSLQKYQDLTLIWLVCYYFKHHANLAV
jgi:hypothetical protein